MDQTPLNSKLKSTLDHRYQRVSHNVDFHRMVTTTVFCIGTGAIGPAVEQWVRLGITCLYLFDTKRVRKKNLVAQNFRHSDIGNLKPEALKGRLQECQLEKDNPAVPDLKVHTYGDFLAISDSEIETILKTEKAKGREIVMVMASDYHPVQARGSRIALKYGIAVFWVGIYRMGQAGEIIYYIPGHELPCYRCITETRYNFFDTNRLVQHINGEPGGSGRSSGLPMAASFIDAVLSHLIIGYIHRDIETNPHGKLFRRILNEKRNLIQCQLDPDYRLNNSENIFAQIQGKDQIAFNTLFQVEPRNQECIECRSFSGNYVWQSTDYTQENYRHALESFSRLQAHSLHDKAYKHPLLDTYGDYFQLWEEALSTHTKNDQPHGTVEAVS